MTLEYNYPHNSILLISMLLGHMCDIDDQYESQYHKLIEPYPEIPLSTMELVVSLESRQETIDPTYEWYSNPQSTILISYFQ